MPDDWPALLSYEHDHVWHPYSPLPATLASLPVVSATGTRLRLADGRELVDAMASWWSAIWGYRHPVLDAALEHQIGLMSHVMFGGLTHAPAIELAQRLGELAPPGLDRVFLADSGSVSVEVALKTCLQYQRNRGQGERSKFLALAGGYHGDTLGAMAVCDPVGGMHHLFAGSLPRNHFAPRPPGGDGVDPDWEAEVRRLADRHEAEIAAIVAEPCVQGAGGMWFYDPGYLRVLRDVADEHAMLLLLDEIATGFGRAGTMFASQMADVTPDVMCVGKALTGGYLTLAAMLCTAEVAEVVSAGEENCLMHGPTYMANPLACAVALASTSLLASGAWQDEVRRVGEGLRAVLDPAIGLPGVKDVRTLGAIGVVQLDHPVNIAAATGSAIGHGVWLRPFRDLIYAMPPYITSDEDIATVGTAMVAAASVA
jgi:adenosylmethionine-8-amino-7-oxononanoate aminotransferase